MAAVQVAPPVALPLWPGVTRPPARSGTMPPSAADGRVEPGHDEGPRASPQAAKLWQAARDFEAMAIGQLLQPMFATVDTKHSAFGGGEAEATWRPMLVDAIGKQMAAHGGIGLAVPVFNAMLRAQEQRG